MEFLCADDDTITHNGERHCACDETIRFWEDHAKCAGLLAAGVLADTIAEALLAVDADTEDRPSAELDALNALSCVGI